MTSIKQKMVLAFLIVSVLPFAVSIFFVFQKGKEQLKDTITEQQFVQLNFIQKTILKDFNNLNTELFFWSGNQILNDILVEDIDKRIQKFLISIKEKRGLIGELLITDDFGKIIASTKNNFIGKSLSKKYLLEYFSDLHKFPYLEKKVIKILAPVFSNFREKEIGYMIILLYPEFFSQYTYTSKTGASSIFNRKEHLFVGKEMPIPKNMVNTGFFEYENNLILFKQIEENYLRNWYILLQIDKSRIYNPIISMEKIYSGVAFLGIFLILFLSYLTASKLVKPIKQLTETAEYISKTRNYSIRAKTYQDDEIGILTKAFNNMLNEIQTALNKIEKENQERLKLFANLIEIFNKITKASSEKEVISIVTGELKKFMNIRNINFVEIPLKKGVNIPISTETVKGYIFFDLQRNISNEEKKFFNSIGRMVNLYIERLELLNKAKSASKAKSLFISNISHELRTPLNSIIGFAQFIQMTSYDENLKRAAKSIEISGKHLLEIINDILDFAKIEAEAIKINKRKFNLNNLLQEINTIIEPLATEKNLKLIIPLSLHVELETDYRLLKQVLINLLSNAVKFTEKGYIKLEVIEGNNKICFHIIDTGIGIEPEKLSEIFKPFTQLENPLQKKNKGTGLGLTISQNYINILGGKLYAKSEGKYKGSEFYFCIKKFPD